MALPHAEKLIERARQGERLPAKDRQHCVAFLMSTQPSASNVELGTLFQVSERQIRNDKDKIRRDRARLIKEDDIGLVIADIALSFDNQVRDIEASKRKCKMGGRTYLEHCKAIFKLQLEKINALQELGYYPKDLGRMTVEKFEYKAIVDQRTGAVDTRPVEAFTDEDVIDGDFVDVSPKQLPAPSHTVRTDEN